MAKRLFRFTTCQKIHMLLEIYVHVYMYTMFRIGISFSFLRVKS